MFGYLKAQKEVDGSNSLKILSGSPKNFRLTGPLSPKPRSYEWNDRGWVQRLSPYVARYSSTGSILYSRSDTQNSTNKAVSIHAYETDLGIQRLDTRRF
jgi:hypothetical protein